MQLTLIKGGLDTGSSGEYEYVDGYVTDTRLMGVLGLRLHWRHFPGNMQTPEELYHFYYYDIEEIGLDSLVVSVLETPEDVEHATKASFGGLGAKMVPVSELQARWMVSEFVRETKAKNQPLPSNINAADFIISDSPQLSPGQIRELWLLCCTDITNDYGAVNYYLMRLFGKDAEGSKLLRSGDVSDEAFDDVSLPSHATFLKNTIEEYVAEDGKHSYLSESLVEGSDSHWLVMSEITVEKAPEGYGASGEFRIVTSCRKRSAFRISLPEASMMLSHKEYVTVYEIIAEMDHFDAMFEEIALGTTRTDHDTGIMFMKFKPDNSHALQQVFNLSDDVRTLYYATDYGQLIMASESLEDILISEREIAKSAVGQVVVPTGKYQFAQSLVYDFALSGFTDFEEYLKSLES